MTLHSVLYSLSVLFEVLLRHRRPQQGVHRHRCGVHRHAGPRNPLRFDRAEGRGHSVSDTRKYTAHYVEPPQNILRTYNTLNAVLCDIFSPAFNWKGLQGLRDQVTFHDLEREMGYTVAVVVFPSPATHAILPYSVIEGGRV